MGLTLSFTHGMIGSFNFELARDPNIWFLLLCGSIRFGRVHLFGLSRGNSSFDSSRRGHLGGMTTAGVETNILSSGWVCPGVFWASASIGVGADLACQPVRLCFVRFG
jgi:hypothetical protein